MKTGLEQVDGFLFNALRLTVSAIVLALLAWREYRRGVAPKPALRRRSILTFSLIVSGLYQVLFLLGLERTTAGNAALIIATVPLWTALIARICLSERLVPLAWLGLLIALAGTVIVAFQKGSVDVGSTHLDRKPDYAGCRSDLVGRHGLQPQTTNADLASATFSRQPPIIALPIHWLISATATRR